MVEQKEFIASLSRNLDLKNGIWYSQNNSTISYPESGNDVCYQIEENSFWFKHRNNCIIEALKNFPPNGTIFDIGGGNGFVTGALSQAGYDVVLLEPGLQGALNGQKRGLKDIICSTLEDACFQPDSLPAVGTFDVVEHIQNDSAFIKEIFSLLQPSGRLILTVPAYNFLWSVDDIHAGHYRRYTIKTMTKVLKDNGFEVEYVTYFFSILTPLVFFFRSLPSILGFRKIYPEKYKNEHKAKGLTNKIFKTIWKKELQMIKMKKKIFIGSSILVVAKKV